MTLSSYLRGGLFGTFSPALDTAKSWAADPPMIEEQRGTLVPGMIPRHVAGEHPRTQLAVPGILHDPYMAMARLFDAAGAERAGMPTDDRQSARDAFDVAGLAAMGGFAMPKPDEALGIFGGRLAKTADHAKLAQAEDMWARGVPREDVWRDTGWFRGVDGKPRFEIDDSAMAPRDPESWARPWKTWNGEEWALEEPSVGTALGMGANSLTGKRGLFNHQDLASAYPDIAGLRVSASNGSAFGTYSPAYNGSPPNIGLRGDLGLDDAASIALHEAQHAAQDKEGFAVGSALRGWGDEANKSYWNTAGEVESRAVEARRNLTPEQRAARPPWLDYDVPEAQQIVRMGSGGPQMSIEPPKPANALGSAGGKVSAGLAEGKPGTSGALGRLEGYSSPTLPPAGQTEEYLPGHALRRAHRQEPDGRSSIADGLSRGASAGIPFAGLNEDEAAAYFTRAIERNQAAPWPSGHDGIRPYDVYGVRHDSGPRKIGDSFEQSRIWDDGVPTSDTVGGVSTIGIRRSNGYAAIPTIDDIKSAVRGASNYGPYGDDSRLYLVGAERREFGQDTGEHVLKGWNSILAANPDTAAAFGLLPPPENGRRR